MSEATFAPAPGAAPFSRMVLAQAAMETKLLLRNGEQLLIAVVVPVMVLVGGVTAGTHLSLKLADSHPLVDIFTPGVLALAIMSTAFTSLAIATGFERRYGVIKRLGASPLPRSGLLLGKVLALLVVQVLQVAVLAAVGAALGWSPHLGPQALLGAALSALLGTAAFASLGLLIAGTLRAEATLAAANLLYLLLMAGGAVVLPTSAYGPFGHVARFLPSGALGEGMRTALLHGRVGWLDLLVLAVWAGIGATITARTFKWE